jgi:hypothetical protein
MTRSSVRNGCSVRGLDVERVRAYLRDAEALAREGRTTRDPRVLLATLEILGRQRETVKGFVIAL